MAEGKGSGPSQMDDTDVIGIRCWGHMKPIKQYYVFGINQNSLIRLPYNEIHYSLVVNENLETVDGIELVSNCKIFDGTGGLYRYTDKMTVTSPVANGDVIGTLEMVNIKVDMQQRGPPNIPINWEVEAVNINYDLLIKDHTGEHLVNIKSNMSSASVLIQILTPDINRSQRKKIMIILSALRAYYGIYKYYTQPVPTGMLGNTLQGTPFPLEFAIFEQIQLARIRASCANANGDIIYDVLDGNTHRINMTIVVPSSGNMRMVLTDTYGKTLLTVQIAVVDREEVYLLSDHAAKPFAKIMKASTAMFDSLEPSCNEKMVEYEADPLPSQQSEGKVRQIYLYTPTTRTFISEYYQEKGAGTILLSLYQNLEKQKKALMLVRAMIVALEHFKIEQDLLIPKIAEYPYQK